VRDPRELGAERVRVSLVLGDLADPASMRHAMRGVDCVVHLAAALRDSPRASIEELNALATVRLVRAAEGAGVERFVLLSTLGASEHAQARYLRSRALAERAVAHSALATTVLAPSLVIARGERLLRAIERLSWLPAVPVYGSGAATCQPIAAEDVAACALNALDEPAPGRFELAGPATTTYAELTAAVLRARGRRRRLVHLPRPAVRAALVALERTLGTGAAASPDEADLLDVSLVSDRGTADAERLGVRPRPLSAALTS
jgi:NADH dehydrogenase